MNILKKLIKSLFAVVMIAALAACAMGSVDNTTVTSNNTAKVKNNGIYLNIVIDMGRTALPEIVQTKLESDFAYRLTGSLKTDTTTSIDVSGANFAALKTELAKTSLPKAGTWNFTLTATSTNVGFTASTGDVEIKVGTNNLTFSLGLKDITSTGNGTISIDITKFSGSLTAEIYKTSDNTKVATLTLASKNSESVAAGDYKVVIKDSDNKIIAIEYAIVLGDFTTKITGKKVAFGGGVVVPQSTNNSNQIAALQLQINATPAGGTVNLKLNEAITGLDSVNTLKINKPITVNASQVTGVGKGIALEVASGITSNVKLQGFQSSSLKISSSSLANLDLKGRGAMENENGDTFKKFGDDALPLMLDGCSFTEFKSEDNVAVYFEGEKSAINELEIMKGKDPLGDDLPEDIKFTFIDMGENKEPEDMAYIGKMYVDKGISDVNLIGGKFDEVEFKDPAAGDEINFKFDGEFDQFADATFKYGEVEKPYTDESFWKDDFWGDKLDVKDITVADYDKANGAGVYKYTMNREQFNYLDGGVSIIFLTNDQLEAIQNQDSSQDPTAVWDAISPEAPAYTMSLMGTFAADSTTDGVHTIHGTESHYMVDGRVGNRWTYQQVYLDYYQNYSKDAVVVEIGSDKVTYYVNVAAVRKSDLLIGAYPHYEAVGDAIYTSGGIAGAGSKLSMIDLSQYTPYFVIDTKKLELVKCAEYLEFNGKEWMPKRNINQDDYTAATNSLDEHLAQFTAEAEMFFPMAEDAGFFEFGQPCYRVFSMEGADAYPTNLVEDDPVRVPDNVMGRNMVDVYYWIDGAWSDPKRVIIGTIDPWLDDWYYFTSEETSDEVYFSYEESWDNYGNHSFYYNSNDDPEMPHFHPEFDGKFYARPKEKINQFIVGLEYNPDEPGQMVELRVDDNMPGFNFGYSESGKASMDQQVTSKRELIKSCSDPNDASKSYYLTYDWGKTINEGRFSDPIDTKEGRLDLENLKEGDTVYVVSPYVILNEVSDDGTVISSATFATYDTWQSVSLYETAVFDNLNWYKEATLTNKWTKDELFGKVEAEVFFKKEVIVYDTTVDQTGTPMAYDTFVTNVDNGQTYYTDPNYRMSKIINPPAQDPTDPNPAPTPMGNPLEIFGNPVKVGQTLKVYKELTAEGKDKLGLTILDGDQHLEYSVSDDSLIGTITSALDLMTKGKGYDLFRDEDRTQPLTTRAQLEALEYGATIYATYKGKKFNSYTIYDNDEISPTSSTITEDDLLAAITTDMSNYDIWCYYYKNSDKTGSITSADDIVTLTDRQSIYCVYSEPLINVDTGSGILQKKKSEIINLMYVETSNVTVPFGGKAYQDSCDFTAQYLFYSDSEKTQLFSSSNDINDLSGNTTIYAEKLNNVIIVGGGITVITLPDSAIEKYFAAGAHFYPDASMQTQLTTLDAINDAFTESGKIYLSEPILAHPTNGSSPNDDLYVFTVYIDDGSGFGSAQVMFQEAIYDYIYGNIGAWYDLYSDEACLTSMNILNPDRENGATVYLKKREQQP